jgi:type VI secretion system protein ImpA
VAGPITSREEAFRRLAEVAAYLRRTEPQSPVPHLIDRAISWGRLPFDELLREMIKDEGTRGQVRDLLGIRAKDDQS